MSDRPGHDVEPELHRADVLVLGGGPAGAWAAVSAAERGASVVLADKGYCGTSGATAAGGNNLWLVPPADREQAMRRRESAAGRLTDAEWMSRVLETTWERIGQLAAWGYPFPVDPSGVERRSSLQGPEYMRRMRRKVHRSGVRILDHHPALELLADNDGVVAGAAGIARQQDCRPWRVEARATVLATGGCAFLAGGFGTNVNTGEGQLMAAEVGAELSGMEFSTAYALSAAWGVHTKGLMMQFASYYDADGRPIAVPAGTPGRAAATRLLASGVEVHARLDRAPADLRAAMRTAQPNFFIPLEKAGIDPFADRYPIRMVYEGTVRGTGGLHVVDSSCATTVPGLFAAGDAATRELITGAISGGGSHNGAWAISSGTYAGRGAAAFARSGSRSSRPAAWAPGRPTGRAGLRPTGTTRADLRPDEVIAASQAQVLPAERSFERTESRLRESAATLESLWPVARELIGDGREALRARQAAAFVAQGRWITAAALARHESRGMHRRSDRPAEDPRLDHRLLVSGLDRVAVRPDPRRPVLIDQRAELERRAS